MSSPQFQHLFTPFTIGPMTVRNRIAVPGHNTNFMPSDGPPTERMLHYWLTKARGGVGMITTHVHSVLPRHTGAPPTAIQSGDWIPGYRKVVDALHGEGVKFLLQLNHVGARGSSRPFGGVIMAPSAVPLKSFLASGTEIPHEMDAEDIHFVVEAFRQAAVKAREAGFDGIEVQGEVSFMVAQFMSPTKNLRQDEYGGSLDNRLRFAREVIAAVGDGLGSDRVVGIRLSGDEISEDGLTLDDMLQIAPRLEATGNLDFIHVGAGPGIEAHIPPTYYKAGGFVYLTEAIRKVVKLPLMCSQRINDPPIAEDVLARGVADIIAMNRAIMTDPEMPRKAQEGRLDEIRHCIACNECIGRNQAGMPIACTMNPEMGREQEMTLVPTDTPKRVMIVGGGPAGLEAARVAALRGHQVTLYEKGDRLGGQSLIASRAPGREDLDEVRRYFAHQMKLLGVDVRLESEVNEGTVERESPDSLIVATGSRPIVSDISSADVTLVDARAVLSEEREWQPEQRVVVLAGEHQIQALSAADFLAEKGCRVYVLTEALYAGAMLDAGTLELIYRRLLTKGVTITPLTAIKLMDGRTVVTENVFSKDEGRIESVDMIVTAYQGEADDSLRRDMKGRIDDIHLIGDALAPRRMMDAILDGARAGRLV